MNVPKVTFSKTYTKGSNSDRMKKAIELNEGLFSKLYAEYKNSDLVGVRQIERVFKETMPEPIYFNVKKLLPDEEKKMSGGLVKYFYENKICKYKISIISQNNQLHISNLPTLMHESMHLFEMLLNPKLHKVLEKVIKNSLSDKKGNLLSDFYYNNQYYADNVTNKLFLIKTKIATKKALKNMKPEDKILFLHSIRDDIQSEIVAFNETNKYANKLKSENRKFKAIEVDKYYKSYMFEQKLKIVNELLNKIIQKERLNNAQKF